MEQEEIALRVRNEHQETNHISTDASNRNRTLETQEDSRDQNNTPAEEDPIGLPDLEPQEDISPELNALRDRILEVMLLKERTRLPSLRSCDRAKLRAEVGNVNEATKRIETHNITELNSLMYAAAYVTTEKMGMLKKRKERRNEEPFWMRRIKQTIETSRKDLSKIEEIRRGNMRLKQRERERLNRKYHLEENGTLYVSDMLKQKIKAGAIKIKRYDERCQQFKQNQQFQTNQKRFYDTLDGKKREEREQPDPIEATTFWRKIWSEEIIHNEQASWLEQVEQEFSSIDVQEDINITMEDIRTGVSKMANWKAAGPDLVQGYWFKKLPGLHPRLQLHLQDCVRQGNVPEWMVKGRTVLIQKDPTKGTQASNYRPIACLPIMWKLLTGIMGEKLYQHLDENGLLADEQKGCRKGSRGTKDQLLVDKAILKNCRRRLTNLSMAWIDYKKAYDMVPHSWILKCLEMVGGAKNMITVISNSMVNWKTVLTSEGTDLGQVDIRRGIFQGDSLSPLLFVLIMLPLTLVLRKVRAGYRFSKEMKPVNHLLFMDDLKLYGANKDQLDSLVQVVRIFSQDIRMSFGLDKCAVLEMRRGRQVGSSGIDLPDDQHIREVEEEGYKYLGILQLDKTLNTKMKGKITSEYVRRVKKLGRSKLNGGNMISGINAWAVSVIRYSAGIVDWTVEELVSMDRRTRKILAMNGCMHTRSNVARLYLPRKEGGRGLISIEECVNKESKSLHGYLRETTEWMLQAALKEKVLDEEENLQDYQKRRQEEKIRNWKEKALHGEFVRQTADVAGEDSWRWLRNGFLKKETEGLILAAQEQALRTNSIKHSIDKTSETPLCRLCGDTSETVRHIISGCKKLAQGEYRKRHDKVALRVHWEICRKYGIECTDKWYDHQPLAVAENRDVRITWDMTVYTDKKLNHNRPDITLLRKDTQEWTLIDIAVPADQNIINTEEEKVAKYQELAFEIKRIHRASKVTVIPIVIGALGTISKNAKTWHGKLDIADIVGSAQLSAILGTAHILRKVLCF